MSFQPEHLLSSKSAKLGRNFFIFNISPSYFRLVFGLNLDKHSHVTHETLYRWLDLVCEEVVTKPTFNPYGVFPVKVRRSPGLVFHYTARPSGEALPRNDTKLVPGDYTACSLHNYPDVIETFTNIPMSAILYELDEHWAPGPLGSTTAQNLPWAPFITKPEGFRELKLTTSRQCFITGTEEDSALDVAWIYPPNLAFELHFSRETLSTLDFDTKDYTGIENGIVLRKELVHAFEANAIGIDVDDNYRVIVFDDSELGDSPIASQIPSHATPPINFRSTRSEELLRQHFVRSMRVYFLGGDIRLQYPDQMVLDLMEDLGIGPGSAGEPLDLMDKRWHDSELGEVLLQSYLEGAVDERRWDGYDDDSEDEDEDDEGSDYANPNVPWFGPPWDVPEYPEEKEGASC